MTGLKERLRSYAQGNRTLLDKGFPVLNADICDEAADRIEELEALSEQRREALEDLMDSLGAMSGGDHELLGWSISEERCAEIRRLARAEDVE